jgi:hypothetical protein
VITSDGSRGNSSNRVVVVRRIRGISTSVDRQRQGVLTAACITSFEFFVVEFAGGDLFGFVFSSFEVIEELRMTGLHFDHVIKATNLEIRGIGGLGDYGSGTKSDDGKGNGSTDHDDKVRDKGNVGVVG